MNKLKQIDTLFGLTGLIVLVLGLVTFTSTLDINVHDTYISISQTYVVFGLAFLMFLISYIYFAFRKHARPLRNRLGQIHFITTTIPMLIVVFPPTALFRTNGNTANGRAFDNDFDINSFLAYVGIVFALGQLIFISNIIWTIFERKKKATP